MYNSADNKDVVAAGETYEDAIAEGVLLDGAKLTNITFRQCDMYWSSFFLAKLVDVTFEDCDLRGADLKEMKLTNVRFVDCDVGTDAIGGETQFEGTDLTMVEFINCRGR